MHKAGTSIRSTVHTTTNLSPSSSFCFVLLLQDRTYNTPPRERKRMSGPPPPPPSKPNRHFGKQASRHQHAFLMMALCPPCQTRTPSCTPLVLVPETTSFRASEPVVTKNKNPTPSTKTTSLTPALAFQIPNATPRPATEPAAAFWAQAIPAAPKASLRQRHSSR